MCRAKQKSRLWLHFIEVEDGNATNFIWIWRREERGEESPVHAKEKVLCFEAALGNFGWKWPSGQANTQQRCFIDL